MLRLSKLGDYGTVIMACMALEPERLYRTAEVASMVGVPLPTAGKVLKTLARGGLLVSQRGAKGGYTLARRAQEISIAQIIVAVEGPLGMTECSAMAGLCLQEAGCPVRGNWLRINAAVLHALESVNLADFARPAAMPGAVPIDLGAIRARRQGACTPEL
jgi:FeS assembly SUF system regulator